MYCTISAGSEFDDEFSTLKIEEKDSNNEIYKVKVPKLTLTFKGKTSEIISIKQHGAQHGTPRLSSKTLSMTSTKSKYVTDATLFKKENLKKYLFETQKSHQSIFVSPTITSVQNQKTGTESQTNDQEVKWQYNDSQLSIFILF